MSPTSTAYTLVGFSVELDWRPLHFVKPIPLHRVCEACGLVRKRTALLPCRHTLCECCYHQCVQDGAHVCPLDGRHCEDGDVELRDCDADGLLKREVKCWNEGSNCTSVVPASQIAQHFQRECRHHCIRCPRCSATVLCNDVCAHLESECSTTATPAVSESEGDSCRKEETALLASFRQILEVEACELKAHLERLLPGSEHNSDRLSEVVHGVNNCQETLREELRQGFSRVTDILRQEVVQIRKEYCECVKKFSDEIAVFSEETKERLIPGSDTMNTICNGIHALEKPLRDSQVAGGSEGATGEVEANSIAMGSTDKEVPKLRDLQPSECEFVVKGIKSLEEKAPMMGYATYMSERVYLGGYCMSPGVFLWDRDFIMRLSALFLLHKADMDDGVLWPFEKAIRLRVMHPNGGAELQQVECPCDQLLSRERPREGPAKGNYWFREFLPMDDLIRQGYVQYDQLRVKFELLP